MKSVIRDGERKGEGGSGKRGEQKGEGKEWDERGGRRRIDFYDSVPVISTPTP